MKLSDKLTWCTGNFRSNLKYPGTNGGPKCLWERGPSHFRLELKLGDMSSNLKPEMARQSMIKIKWPVPDKQLCFVFLYSTGLVCADSGVTADPLCLRFRGERHIT